MKYVKRLVILSGERGKGTLNLERNAYGVFGKLNTFGGGGGSLDLVLRVDGKIFTYSVKDKGGFNLEGQESAEYVQAAVFESGRLIMFGTNEPRRLSAAEAEQMGTFLKKESKPLFSVRDMAQTGLSKFSYSELLSGENEQIETKNNTAAKLDYGTEKTEIKPDLPQEIKIEENFNAVYQDELIAEENFYPREISYDAAATAAEQKIRSINLEKDDFLQDYAVSPAGLSRAFLSVKSPAQNFTGAIKAESAKPPAEPVSAPLQPSTNPVAAEFVPAQQYFSEFKNKETVFKPAIKFAAGAAQKKAPDIFGRDGKNEKLKTLANYGRDGEGFSGIGQNAGFAEAAADKSFAVKNQENALNLKNPDSRAAYAGNNTKTAAQRVSAENTGRHINARQGTFFERNGEEIEKLFKGPREEALEKLLPGSRWVKINYDNSGRFYVIGLIGKEFLCYGVPASFSPQPPEELKGYCWWLPLIPDKPEGKGYWIMYQNLITGETVYPK